MIQAPLEVYRIDMKYIRNLHNIDDRVLSVSPQIGKDERPFLGVLVIYDLRTRSFLQDSHKNHV